LHLSESASVVLRSWSAAAGQASLTYLLSILDPDWPVPEALGNLGEHNKLELRFHDMIEQYGADLIAPQRLIAALS
jgi:hypothetical protein